MKGWKKWALGAGVLVVAIAGLFYFNLGAQKTLQNAITYITLPPAIAHAWFISGITEERTLSRFTMAGIEHLDFPGKTVIDTERVGDTTLALLQDNESDETILVRLTKDGPQQITADGDPKENIAISPDKTYIAFSVKGPAIDTTFNGYDVRRYTTHVLKLEDGTPVATYPGNHPHFLDNQTLILFSKDGLVVRNFETGEESTLFDSLAYLTVEKPSYGNNGVFVTLNPVSLTPSLYRIVSLYPFSYEFVGDVPIEVGYEAKLDGDTLYVLSYHRDTKIIDMLQYSIDDLEHPKTIFSTAVEDFLPWRIVF